MSRVPLSTPPPVLSKEGKIWKIVFIEIYFKIAFYNIFTKIKASYLKFHSSLAYNL